MKRVFGFSFSAALLLLLSSTPLVAHDLGVARVELEQLSDRSYQLSTSIPASESVNAPEFPERFDVVPARRGNAASGVALQQAWVALTDGEALTTTDSIGLLWPRDGAFVTATWMDGRTSAQFFPLTDTGTHIEIGRLGGEAPPLLESMGRYTKLGFEHILSGWDHLAFVLALCLLQRGWALVKLVTAFTVGHSVTLIAAVVGWIQLPAPPVEACIALSIVMVAAKSLAREPKFAHGYGIVFAFGLLHGLGFAGALTEIGMPRAERVVGLLSFNIGVELGQIAFVLVLTGLALVGQQLLKRSKRAAPSFLQPAISAVLVLAGGYWTVERIAQF